MTVDLAAIKEKPYYFSNRALKRLIVPMIIEQFLAILVGMSDSIMVATVGEHAVSGVSLVDNIFILLIYLFAALATGGAVVMGQYLGQNKHEKANRAVNQLILFTALFAICIMIGLYLARNLILHRVFGAIEANVMEASKTYLLIVSASIPFIALYNAGAAVFRTMGNSKVPMYLSMMMNAINVGGNAILIFGFGMGVAGAATSTLVSRVISAVAIILLLCSPEHLLHLERPFSFKLDFGMLKKIAYIGIPNGLENGMFQLGKIMVLSMITGFGTAAIAANAVSNIIATFQVLPGMSVGMAVITVCSRCVGAGDYEAARYYTRKILKLVHILIIVFSVTTLVALPGIMHLYNLSDDAMTFTKQIIWYHGICCMLIWPEAFTLPNTLRAASDVKFCMILSIISMWVFRIAFSYIIAVRMGMGVLGVWIAMTIDWAVRAVLFIIRYRGKRWQHKSIA
ncbi:MULTISPECIES: MATE family efflux transporter [Clostridia]|jgi:putative MATE family efflux protein|uniref:MATE family efflux transporter n=1 Tax=Clostridium sp. MCC345 TaxID=2592645 RepID=UPI001C024875|nr:MATE family efflux transporter [Clostridium sp. MCC345]